MPELHPRSHYSEPRIPPFDGAVLRDEPEPVDDVEGRFERIADSGSLLAVLDGGVFEGRRKWRYTWVERAGVNFARNHLQGVQRKGRHLLLTGGDATEPVSHLFVVAMESRRERGPWGSNVLHTSRPQEDGLVRVAALDPVLWHAGGISLMGDVLAVPLEGDGRRSRVLFLHVRDPVEPAELVDAGIARSVPKAGAAALTRLPDGHFLCGVWWEDDDSDPPGCLDLYLSKSDRLTAGFDPTPSRTRFPTVGGRKPEYQSIALLAPERTGAAAAAPVRLHLLGTENTSPASPFVNGSNLADLFTVELDVEAIAAGTASEPVIEHVGTRELRLEMEWGNLDAAGGVQVGPDGLLSLYCGYHWRLNDHFRLSELHGTPPPRSVITDVEDAWIELHEHDGFRGRRLSLFGAAGTDLPDYDRLHVQGGDFAGTVSSIRYQLPPGSAYRLYTRPGYESGGDGPGVLELEGSGLRKQISNLSHSPYGFDDRVRSSRYVGAGDEDG